MQLFSGKCNNPSSKKMTGETDHNGDGSTLIMTTQTLDAGIG